MSHNVIVAKIDSVTPIEKADRIHVAHVLGSPVIVSKDWVVGKVGLFFQADLQLSEAFCTYNNLYRDAKENADPEKTGFFEKNRRVRAQPFLGVKSEGFFCELDALNFTGAYSKIDNLRVGDQFDELDGHEVCKKYISEKTRRAMQNIRNNGKKIKNIESPMFLKHVDTDQYAYQKHKIERGDLISIQAKRHGTSGRYSYSKVLRKPTNWYEKVLNKVGLYKEESWEYLTGTRNVVLYEENYDKEGFHGSEQFRFDVLEQLKPHLERGMEVFVEIVGYVNDKPIMPDHSVKILKDKKYTKKYGDTVTYNYGCPDGEFKFHIYRIAYVNEDGSLLDFTEPQLQRWCKERGLEPTYNVCGPFIFDGDFDKLDSMVKQLTEREEVLTEDFTNSHMISEGVIVRVDKGTQTPLFLKSKSFAFKCMEGIAKENEVDLEDAS